ncbi:unnamed protein product [Cuscuta epithymum]|uniref:E2 ubiquitin-conjugating enzyme n=1 Tax=Cuscuta epithymum TaxID=186058 RepID=A0AAV0EE73_9ASTE|nr:unnamed protein product [Cuscuta epithymum]
MESPSQLSRYATKKMVFPGGSSKDVAVDDIPPSINGTSKTLKQKEISLHDIIHLDIEDDDDDSTEARLDEGTFMSNGKEKIFIDLSYGPSDGSEVKGAQTSKKNYSSGSKNVIDLEDSESCGEDYMSYDKSNSMLGQYKNLQSHSEVRKKINISSGSIIGKRTTRVGPSVSFSVPALGKKRSAPIDTSIDTNSKKKPSNAEWINPPLMPLTPPTIFPGYVPSGHFLPHVTPYGYATAGQNIPHSLQSASTCSHSSNIDEITKRFRAFKKFDIVQDVSGHHYSKNASKRPSKAFLKRIQEEWKSLEKNLPDKIFVRVYESKMDLMRAVIIGAAGTPYHDGLFFFDVYFPSNYPSVPPKVHYHSGGLRINPNLYNCGKVCLSLLNTWSGSGKEKWIPRESTMLQVLVSIQGLILNAQPYFNEPGYAASQGTPAGEKMSLQYNESTFISNLRTMVYSMNSPPKHFEDFVVGYFVQCAQDVLVACKTYIDGAQVGSLVGGGVQDVDESDKSCSDGFKKSVASFIRTLVTAFTKIGAKDCDKFLYLQGKTVGQVFPPMTLNNFFH